MKVPCASLIAAAAVLWVLAPLTSALVADDTPGQQTKTIRIEVEQSESSSSKDQGDGSEPVRQSTRTGRIVIVGPDGKRQEFFLDGSGVPSPANGERVKKLMIGVALSDVPPELAAHIGLDNGLGALIQDVKGGGPAEKAGLKKYDVITHVGDQAVLGQRTLQTKIEESSGEPLKLRVIHAGQPKEVELKAEEMEVELTAVPPGLFDGRLLPDDMMGQLKWKDEFGSAFMLVGPGVQIPPAPPAPPQPPVPPVKPAAPEDMKKVAEEIEQLRKELHELKESLKAQKPE